MAIPAAGHLSKRKLSLDESIPCAKRVNANENHSSPVTTAAVSSLLFSQSNLLFPSKTKDAVTNPLQTQLVVNGTSVGLNNIHQMNGTDSIHRADRNPVNEVV
jgi:hypothetical protein